MSRSEPAALDLPTEQPVEQPVAEEVRTRRYPLQLFRSELHLTFGRARIWMGLGVLAVVPIVIGVAIRLSGNSGGAEGFLGQVAGNGVFLVVAGLGLSMPFFLPTAVTVVSGESLAGEASLGTLRTVLTAPAGRSRLLAAKMVALAVFCVAATMTVWLSGLVAGVVLFPVGDVTTLSGTTVSLAEGLLRALGIAGLISASMLGLAAIGLFISSLTSTPLAAMAATFGGYVVLGILNSIPQIDVIHPWLLMNNWFSFADLMRDPPFWDNIGKNLALQGAYVVVFYAAAWARLTSRDISG
ncbi:MAG: ABC transporter permease [Kribbellaceae bacterium]